MRASTIAEFTTLTSVLFIVLGVILAASMRSMIGANWEANRCDPGVIPIAGYFKPTKDPRTRAQFAEDNWKDCQKDYVQNALRVAAVVPRDIANAEGAVVAMIQDVGDAAGNVFVDVWRFIYEAYSSFMDRMKGVAKLFQNFMIQMHGLVDRMQAASLSIVFGLISMIAAFVGSVQVVLIVAIVIIGILIALQIILFFLLLPISGLIVTMTALIAVVVVSVATAIAAASVAELFTPGACFDPDTLVQRFGEAAPIPIKRIQIGDRLADGGTVTAVHQFRTNDRLYLLNGIKVTGTHLVVSPQDSRNLIPVSAHPMAVPIRQSWWWLLSQQNNLVCLSTTTRRIPCISTSPGVGVIMFADWEEIPEDDVGSLTGWYSEVWHRLNPHHPDVPPPSPSLLESEAGLSPDSEVITPNGVYIRIKDIKPGQIVLDASGRETRVLGCVTLLHDEITNAIHVGRSIVSSSAWMLSADRIWMPPSGFPVCVPELQPTQWKHLYTESGTFQIRGGWCLRDASDVGMGPGLRNLVEDVIVGQQLL
jgi:hypothetical protein